MGAARRARRPHARAAHGSAVRGGGLPMVGHRVARTFPVRQHQAGVGYVSLALLGRRTRHRLECWSLAWAGRRARLVALPPFGALSLAPQGALAKARARARRWYCRSVSSENRDVGASRWRRVSAFGAMDSNVK